MGLFFTDYTVAVVTHFVEKNNHNLFTNINACFGIIIVVSTDKEWQYKSAKV